MNKYVNLLFDAIFDRKTMKSDGEEIPYQSDFKTGIRVDFIGPGAERILQEMERDGIDEVSIPYEGGILRIRAGESKVHLEGYSKGEEF